MSNFVSMSAFLEVKRWLDDLLRCVFAQWMINKLSLWYMYIKCFVTITLISIVNCFTTENFKYICWRHHFIFPETALANVKELTAQNEKLTKDLDEEKSKCENNEEIASICLSSKVYKHKCMFILWENANTLKEHHRS